MSRTRGCFTDLEDLRDVEQVLFQRRGVHQAIVHINERAPAKGGRGQEAPGTPPWMGGRPRRGAGDVGPAAGHLSKSRPTVRDWFMTRVSSENAPCRPNSTLFHSNWPSYDRKLVFHSSAARTRSW